MGFGGEIFHGVLVKLFLCPQQGLVWLTHWSASFLEGISGIVQGPRIPAVVFSVLKRARSHLLCTYSHCVKAVGEGAHTLDKGPVVRDHWSASLSRSYWASSSANSSRTLTMPSYLA
jgi:hypothetical protein